MASAMNRGLLRLLTCCNISFSLSVCHLRYSSGAASASLEGEFSADFHRVVRRQSRSAVRRACLRALAGRHRSLRDRLIPKRRPISLREASARVTTIRMSPYRAMQSFNTRDGIIREWDGWGFAGNEDDSYLVAAHDIGMMSTKNAGSHVYFHHV